LDLDLETLTVNEQDFKDRTKKLGLISEAKLGGLMTEANEVVAMVVASIRTLRRRNPKSKI